LREARHLGDDARPAGVRAVQAGQLVNEVRVEHRLRPSLVQLLKCRHEGLGNIPTTEGAEPSRHVLRSGTALPGVGLLVRHRTAPASIMARTPATGSPPTTSA